ncbi:MAG TPA: M20/M25/M40 family metallo-hydrolase [Candidatus Sumerlaeota bacterium]|nr:M20/M25/M40 family metallo-hydrolase [Candidatus Sumerlaeota bacterium]
MTLASSHADLEVVTRRALDLLARDHAATVSQLADLLAIPSPVGQEGEAQDWVARRLTELELELHQFELDPAEFAHLPGWLPNDRPHRGRPNVIGIWRGSGGGRSLVLNAHIDTVPADPVERWTSDPWTPRFSGGRLYARGAHDDKAGIVEIIAALRALQRVGFQPRGDIIVQSVIEDEPTGNGTLACAARGFNAEAAWVVDGTPLGEAIVNHCGQIQFFITTYGSGGSIVDKVSGYDAIQLAMEVARELEAFARRAHQQPPAPDWPAVANPLHFAVSRIAGGEWFASRPQKCTLECCMAFNPPETLAGMRERIAAALAAFAQSHPWLRDNPPVLRFEGLATEPVRIYREDHPFFRELGHIYGATAGMPLRWLTLNAWCDLRHFSLHGYVPAVLTGPGNGGGDHGPDEYIETDSMLPVMQALAAFTVRWCGQTGDN